MLHLPEIVSLDDLALARLGYIPIRVSVFDSWLSESEAENCRILNYSEAVGTKYFSDYLLGEERFLTFYEAIAHRKRIFRNIYDNQRDEFYGTRISQLRFGSYILQSLREMSAIDISVGVEKYRLLGGYDRTALILTRTESNKILLHNLAESSGLFVL